MVLGFTKRLHPTTMRNKLQGGRDKRFSFLQPKASTLYLEISTHQIVQNSTNLY